MATVPEQVKEIVQAAIDSINQLTSLIEHGPTTASGTLRIPSNAHVAEAADKGERQLTTSETTFVRQTQPANSALAELQRRFPTVSRGRAAANRDPVSGRYRRPSNSTSRPYPVVQNARRSAGRPASEIVSKDVMILEMGREKIPTKTVSTMSTMSTPDIIRPLLSKSGFSVFVGIFSLEELQRKVASSRGHRAHLTKMHRKMEDIITGELDAVQRTR